MAKAPAPPKPVAAPAPVAPPAPIAPEVPAATTAPAKPAKSSAVAKRNNDSAVAALSVFEQHSGLGLEEATGDDYAMPFLKLLQAMSPEVGTLPNAEAGDFLHTASNELWSGADGIEFVPCYYQRRYIEWTPRDQGGGFVQVHTPESPALQKITRKGSKDVLPSGNEIQNTAQFIGLARGENGWTPCAMTMKGTQLKKARKWLTAIRSQLLEGANGKFCPPPFAFIYTVKAVAESNDKGRWFGYEIDSAIKPTASEQGLVDQAMALALSVKGGTVKVRDPENDTPTGAPGSKAGFAPEAAQGDDGEDVV